MPKPQPVCLYRTLPFITNKLIKQNNRFHQTDQILLFSSYFKVFPLVHFYVWWRMFWHGALRSPFRTSLACFPSGTIPKNQSMLAPIWSQLSPLKGLTPFTCPPFDRFCAPFIWPVIKVQLCLDLFPLK